MMHQSTSGNTNLQNSTHPNSNLKGVVSSLPMVDPTPWDLQMTFFPKTTKWESWNYQVMNHVTLKVYNVFIFPSIEKLSLKKL
jgi:hypothetical protein